MKERRKTIRVDEMIEYLKHLYWMEQTSDGIMAEVYQEDRSAIVQMICDLAGIPMMELLEKSKEAEK